MKHISVLAMPAVEAVLAAGRGKYVDATFGGGGHSRLLLRQLPADSSLLAIDCDEYAEQQAAAIDDIRFTFVRCNFTDIKTATEESGIDEVQGVLFDLGISSLQLDTAERGLSFMRAGPLDMRLDRRYGKTAYDLIQTSDEKTLTRIFKEYGEEPEARRIARILVAKRRDIQDTAGLAQLVSQCKRRHVVGRHSATLVFLALRIAVNRELESLREGLVAASKILADGGRLVVIAFHSLEDRIVKRVFSAPSFPRIGRVGGLGMRQLGKSLVPSEDEVYDNPRARSARMRIFTKEATL